MTDRRQEAEDIITLSFGYKNSATIWIVQAICKCGYIHIHTYMYIYTHTHTHTYIYMHMYAYIYAYILHTYTNVFYKWEIVYSNNKLKLVDFKIKFPCLSIISVL